MNTAASNNWELANQRHLSAALALVRHMLESYVARLRGAAEPEQRQQALQQALEHTEMAMPAPAALNRLCTVFNLSPFERDLLLLCAGIELDGHFTALCSAAHSSLQEERNGAVSAYTGSVAPTISLALAALPHAHWDAITPSAPLRRWRLISVGNGSALTLSPLRIDERILHYLAGVSHLDERLENTVLPCPANGELAPSQRTVAEHLHAAWSQLASAGSIGATVAALYTGEGDAAILPAVLLCGEDVAGKRAIAAKACSDLGLRLSAIAGNALPVAPGEIETLSRLWEREAILNESALLLDCDGLDRSDAARTAAITRFINLLKSPLIVTSRERQRPPELPSRQLLTFDIRKPELSEQRVIWQNALGAMNLNGHVEGLVSQFNLSASAIHAASREALATSSLVLSSNTERQVALKAEQDYLGTLLWDACRVQARPRLEDLAQRIEPSAAWDDLVLPEAQRQILREVAAHVRQRATVYETWGFAARGTRGLGISALFAGTSGTGKTLAAEVLAHELRLDLYRIDLSSVVSKYIGETEKNLRRVFDAAEEGGAVLLFDEADALFGKRSEVKDSHDRYANIEVSYLLQRMEVYRGLAILTTNLKSALDTAFLRRIRFIVQFPFPDTTLRTEIWRRIFPSRMPVEHLHMCTLAQLNIPGGNIRNIALNAAFLAADSHEPVRMTHLLRAARAEYAKLEKPLTEAELKGWA